MGKLTVRRVQTAGPGKHEDGMGLRLVVAPTGSRRWIYRYMIDGRRREMGLGSYPDVTLAQAREAAALHRARTRASIDPIEARNREVEPARVPSFTTAAARFIRAHRHGWGNRKHARQWCSTLKTYARPIIGAMPVDQIQTRDVVAVLSPIWTTKTETAKRLQGRIENILDFASAHRWRDPSNPARWRGHLDKLLPRPSRVAAVSHHPAMPYADVPAFVVELGARPGVAALALRFLILTAARTGEVTSATWSEIDLTAEVWTIPADRMKSGREHRVPLSRAALEVLKALPRIVGNPYLFPGARRGRPISNMAMLQLMRGMGYGPDGDRGPFVVHGFRSSFRDWAGEVSSFPRDVCEMALAHVIENKVEAAYRRGDLFEKRRRLMGSWAEWCTKL